MLVVSRTHRERGETIVEAIIAFGIFSAIVTGTILIMNRGVSMAQKSLEMTLVREQVDGQAEMLRYIRNNLPLLWNDITSPTRIQANPKALSPNTATCDTPSSNAYFIRGIENANPLVVPTSSVANYGLPTTYASINHATARSSGIWVETTVAEGTNPVAYDFRVHACWNTSGDSIPVSMGTIVRLYEN